MRGCCLGSTGTPMALDSLRQYARPLWRPAASLLVLAACICPDPGARRSVGPIDSAPPAAAAPIVAVATAPAPTPPTNWSPLAERLAEAPRPTKPFELSYSIRAPKKNATRYWRGLERDVRSLVGAVRVA